MLQGVKFVMINGEKFDIEGQASSLAEVKEAAVQYDPSLSNADAVVEGDTVVFKFRAGTKGADTTGVKFVMINGEKFDIEGQASSLAEIKEAATQYDPSLSNADAVIEGDTVVFKFRAGTKGATIKNISYQGQTFEVTDTNLQNNPSLIHDAMKEAYPELANADYVVEGDTITFKFRAGTKGSTIKNISYQGQTFEVTDANLQNNPSLIHDAMKEAYPELANADYVVEGDTITFKFRAGTKGM